MVRLQFEMEASEFLSDMSREKGFDIHSDQLEPGRFEGLIDFAGTADTQFFRDRFTRSVCIHGSVPKGMAAFTFPVTPESAVFCGEAVASQTLCMIAPGDWYSYRAAAGYPFFGGCVSTERLDRALRLRHHLTLAAVLPRTASVPIGPEAMARMRAATEAAFVVDPHPGLVFDHDAPERGVEDAIVDALCTALTADQIPNSTRLASRNHWRCVRVVRNYVEAHLSGDLTIETLCRVAGVSGRTLDTAFRDVTDCSPRQFVKIRRLNAARHALMRVRPGETSVKAIALDCGFWHLGRFATDYRAYFGESPSASLARERLSYSPSRNGSVSTSYRAPAAFLRKRDS